MESVPARAMAALLDTLVPRGSGHATSSEPASLSRAGSLERRAIAAKDEAAARPPKPAKTSDRQSANAPGSNAARRTIEFLGKAAAPGPSETVIRGGFELVSGRDVRPIAPRPSTCLPNPFPATHYCSDRSAIRHLTSSNGMAVIFGRRTGKSGQAVQQFAVHRCGR